MIFNYFLIFILIIYSFLDLVKKIGHEIPILELFVFLLTTYYITSPLLLFNNSIHQHSDSTLNYIGDKKYFSNILPIIIFFIIGLKFFYKNIFNVFKYNISEIKLFINSNKKFVVLIFFIGLISKIISFFYINIFISISTYFIFLTLILIQLTNIRFKNIFSLFIILYLFFEALQSTVLHTFFIWMLLFFLLFAKLNKIYFKKTILISIIFLFIVIITNFVKGSFREEKQFTNESVISNITNYYNLLQKSLPIIMENRDIILYGVISRISLGETFSKTLIRVPDDVNYFHGLLFFEYLWNSLFLNNIYIINKDIKLEKKYEITDIDKFYYQYITLEPINDFTTVNLSFVENIYINFGRKFSFIFAFLYAFFLKSIYVSFVKYKNIPIYCFFVFIIFPTYLQIETGMQQIINYTIKFYFLFFLFRVSIFKLYPNWKTK